MPASLTLNITNSADILAVCPMVDIEDASGNLVHRGAAVALTIENVAGPVPGKATLRVDDWNSEATTSADYLSPITLNKAIGGLKYGARVKIYMPMTGEDVANYGDVASDDVLFLGNVVGRHDSGIADTVTWEVADDRDILQQIFVRGALTYETDAVAVMNRRYVALRGLPGRRGAGASVCPVRQSR
jgi:hypothetical protein